jgi:molybdopterin synthase sulfur carrier subunit
MRDSTKIVVRLRLVYLARLREAFDSSGETLTIAGDAPTLADVAERLRARGAPWAGALAPGRAVRVAVNHRLAQPADAIRDGDEVAIVPPVTGG